MAQNNRREIELALSITTANADALSKLQQDVKGLAKEGGDAAPAFQKLADELGQLAAQAKQLTALEGLTQELQAAAAAQTEAAAKSGALKQTLVELTTATDAARAAERAKNLELSDAKRAVQEAQDAIAKLKNDTSDAGKSTAGYTIKLVDLKGALLAARAAKRDLSAQLDALKAKTQDAAGAVAEHGRAYREAASDTTKAANAMSGLQAQVDGVTEKYKAAGGAADDLANAQHNLGLAASAVRTAIQGVIADQERLAQAERDAANEALRESAIIADTKRRMAAQARAEADGIIADYQRMERAQQNAAQSAKAAGEAISNAFGTVGQRSAQEIHQEIEKVREAMRLLSTSGAATGTELATAMQRGETAINGLQRELREVTGTLTMADRAATLFKGSMGQIAAGNLVADAVGATVEKVKDLGRAFVAAIIQMDSMRRGLNAIYKDVGTTAAQIEFLRRSASEAGVSFGGLSKEFVKFSAAMTSAQVPLGQSNALFAAITRAAGTLGLSADETAGALNALGQMASKGTVSMEELRQQLGDRLPGAFGLVAKGLGITEVQLVKLVETGNLAARDLFPALTTALGSMQGEVYGLAPAFERLKGALTEVAQGMGDAGMSSALTQALKLLGGAVVAVAMGLSALWEGLYLSGKALEAWGKQISGTKGAWDAFGAEVDKTTERLAGQGRAFQALMASADASTQSQTTTAAAMGATAAAAVAVASGLDGVEKITTLQALAAKLAADNTLDLSAKMVQFNVAASEMLVSQQKQTEASEKVAKAAKTEGETLVAVAKLRGEEQISLVASAAAAENYAAKLTEAAASQQAETGILKLQLAELDANAKARGLSAEAIKAQREALENKIKVSAAETERSNASAEAARQEAVARRIAAESYADNSAKVGEYREAVVDASVAVSALESDHRRGLATENDVRDAKDRLTVAIGKYNDALGDATRLQQAYADASKSVHALQSAGLNLALQQAQSAERMAVLAGNEHAARKAAITQREIEIKIVELKVKAMEAEAQGMLQVARASEAELVAKNALTPVEQVRIANAIRMAEIKALEAKATGASLAAMREELKALRAGSDVREKSTRGIREETAARGANVRQIAAQSDALKKLYDRYRLDPGDPNKSDIDNLYDRYTPSSLSDFDKAVNKSRGEVSGNATLTKEYVDAQIAEQWGEQFIGDSDALELFNAQIKLDAYRTNYGNVVRSQQSLDEQHALLQTVQRLEEKLRVRQAQGLNKRNADTGAGDKHAADPGNVDEAAAPAPNTRRSPTTGGGGVQGGMQTGAVAGGTVVNLNYNGVQMGAVNTDASGRQSLQKFMDALTQARSVAR